MRDNGVDLVDFKKIAGRFFSGHLTGTFPNKKGDFGKKGILESSDCSQSNVPQKNRPPLCIDSALYKKSRDQKIYHTHTISLNFPIAAIDAADPI